MSKYVVDWSHDQSKFVVRCNGKVVKKKLEDFVKGDEIYVENIPIKHANLLLNVGVRIFRCRPNDTSELRDKKGLEKTDEIDAEIIEELYLTAPHVFREYFGQPRLLNLYKQAERLQTTRIAISNQAFSNDDKYAKRLVEELERLEKELDKGLLEELKKYPIWNEWLVNINGLGVRLCGPLVGMIDNIGIKNFNYPSQLRKYAGVSVKDGRSDRKVKGQAVNYNPTLKMILLGRIGKSIVMTGKVGEPHTQSQYRPIYDNEKQLLRAKVFAPGELAAKYGEKSYKISHTSYMDRTSGGPGHTEKMAKRKAVSVFLNHLWVIWRQLEGYETKNDFQFDRLGHETYFTPPVIPDRLQPFSPVKDGMKGLMKERKTGYTYETEYKDPLEMFG